MLLRYFTCLIVLIFGTPASAAFFNESFDIVTVNDEGVITSSPTKDIMLRAPGGIIFPYTGPAPDYPFNVGDPIKISFEAIIPSKQAIQSGIIPTAANGIYTFKLTANAADIKTDPTLGGFRNIIGNGGLSQATDEQGNVESRSNGGLAIVYNAISDSYSINSNANDTQFSQKFALGGLDVASLNYNVLENNILVAQLSSLTRGATSWSGLGGGKGSIGVSNAQNVGTTHPTLAQLSIFFDGAFNVSGPIPSSVPAPPILLIFGIAIGGLVWQRAKNPSTASV